MAAPLASVRRGLDLERLQGKNRAYAKKLADVEILRNGYQVLSLAREFDFPPTHAGLFLERRTSAQSAYLLEGAAPLC
jgi:hypothetical protein